MVRLLLVLVLGVLAGCAARIGAPAPYEVHTMQGATTRSEPAGPHPDSVKVASGDTLYGLSRHWGVPMRAIIDANNLAPPYRLVVGTSLMLPQVRTHTVRAGDTLTNVARQYGVDSSTLAATNHLAPPYVIRTGEVLVLPAPVEIAAAPPPVAPSPPPQVAMAPPPTLPYASPGSGPRVLAVSRSRRPQARRPAP